MKTRTLLAAVATTALVAGSASAAITVDGTDNWQSGNSNLGGTFDASGSDKLVFIVTGEHGFNQTGNGTIGDVFYDGVQLAEAVTRGTIKAAAGPPVVLVDDTWNAIFYLDNPGAVHSAGVITTSGFASRGNVAIVALSGTAAGVGNTAIGDRDTNNADLTTSANSIVIGSYGMGGTGNTANLGSVTLSTDAPNTWDAEVVRQENGSNWDGHVVAYDNGVAAGNANYSWEDSKVPEADGRTGRHVILAEFTEVPEPGSLALLGLGGLLIARRRRG